MRRVTAEKVNIVDRKVKKYIVEKVFVEKNIADRKTKHTGRKLQMKKEILLTGRQKILLEKNS